MIFLKDIVVLQRWSASSCMLIFGKYREKEQMEFFFWTLRTNGVCLFCDCASV